MNASLIRDDQIVIEVNEDVSAGVAAYNANLPIKIEIIGVKVVAKATVASGTIKITDGTSDITDTIACNTDKNVDRDSTLDYSKNIIDIGGTIKVQSNDSAVRARVYIEFVAA